LKPIDPVNLTFARDDSIEHGTVLLAENPTNASKSFLGIEVVDDPALILENYKKLSNSFSTPVYLITPTVLSGPYFIPYSNILHMFYTSPIGDWFYPLSNLFYWIWFINFNLAIFNALPIIPLDGGYVFSRIIKRVGGEKLKESTANYLTYIVSSAMIFLIFLMLALPYIQSP
jgi:membrane-associated protease RseP (regulator of RpoE activity)